jgi:putative hemin transport protein
MLNKEIDMNQAYKDLSERWASLLKENPTLRIRNAAEILGVSEAELVTLNQVEGKRVIRLNSNFKALLPAIEGLGPVMALTRNNAMVHEKTGQYKGVSVHGNMGLALGVIDLRIFFTRFKTGFAVTEETEHGVRNSLQFFDEFGEAVHKIYAVADTNMDAFTALVEEYRADAQIAPVSVSPKPEKDLLSIPEDLDIEGFEQGWSELKDVHHFQTLMKKHLLTRVPAYRAVKDEYAQAIDCSAFEAALEAARRSELSIMLFVGSPGVIQIHTGQIHNLKRTGPWFNVLDKGFNLHADTTQISHAWVVRKPTTDGIVTSLEVFDKNGEQLALMFGERHNGETEQAAWRALIADLEEKYALEEEAVV